MQRNAGNAGTIGDLHALLDTPKAHRILAVARIVGFKDSVTARVNPLWTIRTADGSTWRDKQGLAWVNPEPYEPLEDRRQVGRAATDARAPRPPR